MEEYGSSETMVTVHQTTLINIPENSIHQIWQTGNPADIRTSYW
jgi:hypothetical protein